jgi:uncharacterized membrane protein
MYSKVKIFGHPIHAMLVPFPIAFYNATLVGFFVYTLTSNPFWYKLGIVANWAGVVMAVVAALPGFLDWAIGVPRRTSASTTGLIHMLLNVAALVAFTANAVIQLRYWNDTDPEGATTGIVLSLVGIALTLPAGFLGWDLVQRHHVGVELTPEQEKLEPPEQTRQRPLKPAHVPR